MAITREVMARARAATSNGHADVDTDAVDFVVYDGADDWDFPAPAFTVDQLLPAFGVVWWGGLPKRFKSLLLLYICLAIACRREFVAKRFAIHQAPKILYVAREDGGSRLKDRRDDILAAWGVKPERGAIRFLIKPRLDLMNPIHVGWLRDYCQLQGITLLIVDTWTALSPTADPLAPRDQTVLAAVIVQLAEDINGVVVVVDHSRKNRPEGQVLSSADIFGPPQKWASAEHILMLGKTNDDQRIEAFVEGKDGSTERFMLAISARGSGEEKFAYAGTVEQLADQQRAVGDTNRRAVLKALRRSAEALSASELHQVLKADGIKLSVDTIQRHLAALVKSGEAQHRGSGRATRYFALAVSPQLPSAEIPGFRDE